MNHRNLESVTVTLAPMSDEDRERALASIDTESLLSFEIVEEQLELIGTPDRVDEALDEILNAFPVVRSHRRAA